MILETKLLMLQHKLYKHHLFKNKNYSHYNQLSMTHGKFKSFPVKTLLLPGVILLSIGNILWFS